MRGPGCRRHLSQRKRPVVNGLGAVRDEHSESAAHWIASPTATPKSYAWRSVIRGGWVQLPLRRVCTAESVSSPRDNDWSREVITRCAQRHSVVGTEVPMLGFVSRKLSGRDFEGSSNAAGTPTRGRAKVRAPSAATAHRQNATSHMYPHSTST
jgi:hypothetical protein